MNAVGIPVGRLLASLLLLAAQSLPAAEGRAVDAPARIDDGGIAVQWEYSPGDAGAGVARLTLGDAHSGKPIEGARPAAWLLARRSEQVATEQSCEDKAALMVGGSLGSRADIDLNGYRLLTLNNDNTVAFLNPYVGLRNSKLESIVQLPGTGYDWVWSSATHRLFVTLRDADAVAVIDTLQRTLLMTVATGTGTRPTRLVLDEDARRVWVGLDGVDRVLALDAYDGTIRHNLRVGRGLHTLALGQDVRHFLVTSADSGEVSLIDRGTLAVQSVAVGGTPVAAAWSAAAQQWAVATINGGSVAWIDPVTATLARSTALRRGVEKLQMLDGGRRVLVLNVLASEVSVIDAASAAAIATSTLEGRPDQMQVTDDFAYMRNTETADVQLLGLARLRVGKLEPVRVPMGRSVPADDADVSNVAGVMATAPEGNGILLANPGDATVYRYVEGMMVPIGSFSNYRRKARALMVMDGSLAERTPGVFETALQVERSGRYDVIVRNQAPSITACFVVSLQGTTQGDEAGSSPRPVLLSHGQDSQGRLLVEFVLKRVDGSARLPADSVIVLAIQPRNQWQQRVAAEQLGNGRFLATFVHPPMGEVSLFVSAADVGLDYEQGRLGNLRWPLETPVAAVRGAAAKDGHP